jgi:hypothetical protein
MDGHIAYLVQKINNGITLPQRFAAEGLCFCLGARCKYGTRMVEKVMLAGTGRSVQQKIGKVGR